MIRRVTQVTGIRPSDFAMSSAKTFGDFFEKIKVKPPPKKLIDSVQLQRLSTEANVKVYENRRSIYVKEEEIGRWKLIEKELLDRGLADAPKEILR